ncbi:MAG: DNA gyrase/topoisomerase IV subunit A [Bacteroidales bacterium]|nr:DNA gyrase/topoisomerase IV subunit A [Bacteroidales bacterium]
MDDDELIPDDLEQQDPEEQEEGGEATAGGFASMLVDTTDDVVRHQLRGMYQSWYLDYASYTILDRAIPHIDDGLKPVQRRILHSMKRLDDGRFNKVANIVGDTMKYHPHGDASIYGALVQLGQKELLVETQGNWGNILTGAPAAAGRYIEARLSPFALEVLYNPKVTEWTPSYDGRDKEPVTLPAKFPLLLTQGVGGIAAGLSSLIMPHNFNEIIDAAIAYLKGEPFTLFPDFVTGGMVDVSRYNDGARGGRLRVRAKIEKIDQRTLAITEIPYGLTTGSLSESIIKAFEKGKIKIRKVEDYTAETAQILVHLLPGTSSDKTIDALYAFTDCELAISPNCCVIYDNKPHFLGVSDVLRRSVETTKNILKKDLEILISETLEQIHFASLERIFIEERIYKDKEFEEAPHKEGAVRHIDKRLEPYKPSFYREVTDDDILRLLEIKMARILKFNAKQADELLAKLNDQLATYRKNLDQLVAYTITWYRGLKKKYGAAYPRHTVIRSFDNIEAAAVAEANEKLYWDKEGGFIGTGTGVKRDQEVGTCSSLDDVIIFYRDGRYKVIRVQEKVFIGKDAYKVYIFKRNDQRTTYNVIYQNGEGGFYYMKRFHVTGVSRDKEYNLTPGLPGTKIKHFTANPNGEAEIVKVTLEPKLKLKTLQFDVDFSTLAIKGKGALGNLVTKNEVRKFSLKERGHSTLGGIKVWWDQDVLRLNNDGHGELLGEFVDDDKVLVILKNGEYYTTSYDTANHYEYGKIQRIEKHRPHTVWTAVLFDADQGYYYIKRFTFEPSALERHQRFIGENEKNRLVALTDAPGARFKVVFGGIDSTREPLEIVASEFIGVKSVKAKGKRLTNYGVDKIIELEPLPEPEGGDGDEEEPEDSPTTDVVAEDSTDYGQDGARSDDEVRDELTGQGRMFE